MSASEIAARFGVYKSAGYINGRPKYAIRCPLVESKSGASVHVWDGDDGSVAVDDKHAGCENKAVRDALGISKPSGPPAPIQRRPDPKPEPEPAEPGPLPSGPPFWSPHIYTDAEGNRALAVVRKDLGRDDAGGMRKWTRPANGTAAPPRRVRLTRGSPAAENGQPCRLSTASRQPRSAGVPDYRRRSLRRAPSLLAAFLRSAGSENREIGLGAPQT